MIRVSALCLPHPPSSSMPFVYDVCNKNGVQKDLLDEGGNTPKKKQTFFLFPLC